MFGGVPIMVIFPPNRDAHARGISSFEGAVLVSLATLTTAGNNMATAPMLFINADIKPTPTMMTTVRRAEFWPAIRTINRAIESATPLRVSPPLTIKTAHTVITAGLAKPENASSIFTKPVRTNAASTIIATTSTRNFSVTNKTIAPARILKIRMFSIVNGITFVYNGQSFFVENLSQIP